MTRRLGTVLAAALIAASVLGCSGAPRRSPGGGSPKAGPTGLNRGAATVPPAPNVAGANVMSELPIVIDRGAGSTSTRMAPGGLDDQISRFVSGLDGMSTGGRRLAVATVMFGDAAYIGIDPATLPGAAAGGARPASASGDPRGAAGPGLEGYLRSHLASTFPQVRSVTVTTDPAWVARIARAATTGDAAERTAIARGLSRR